MERLRWSELDRAGIVLQEIKFKGFDTKTRSNNEPGEPFTEGRVGSFTTCDENRLDMIAESLQNWADWEFKKNQC